MFISVDGKAKEVKEIFAGGQDGKAHRVTELFGSVDGTAKRLYTITKEKNAFDQFTWEEIKLFANRGELLEHFNLYDRVTVKLKHTLSNKCQYIPTEGVAKSFDAKQNVLILQITSLTETSMRLSSPYASIFYKMIQPGVYPNDGLSPWTKSTTTSKPFEDSPNVTITTVDYEDSCYWKINDALPEDLKAVAKGYETLRNTVSYSTGGTIENNDYCYVRNLSSPVHFKIENHTDTLPYWYEITEAQFPRKESAYMYHFALPDDYDRKSYFATGQTFFYSTNASDYYRVYYCTRSPRVTYGHKDKYVKPGDGGTMTLRSYQYAQQQGLGECFSGAQSWDFIPEIVIEAD